jgi:hypothetical protein
MKLCPKCQKQFSDDANFCPVDAARLVPFEAQAQATDSLTSRFEVGARVGGRRTGAVHRAIDKTTGKPCVVKLVAPPVVALSGVAQRIERELKQLERVQSAGVAHVIASGKRPGPSEEWWVASELIEGAQTLADAIAARGPIGGGVAANLIEVIGEALIEAAQVGVVHRDLAPKNVLFGGQEVKLINFSLPVPTSDRVPGVPEFVAPEQVEGRPVDQRSNLYSLGALYYFVLTGRPVFMGSPDEVYRAHTSGAIRPPSQLAPVPAPVEALILRALDRSPTKRFLTVRQFVDEVTRVSQAEVVELKSTAAMGKAGRPKGELVQTLMGLQGGIASAPTAAVAPVAPAPPVVAAPPGAMKTMFGMPGPAHTPAQPAAIATPAPAAASWSPSAPTTPLLPGASPWAPSAPTTPLLPGTSPWSASAPTAPVVPGAPMAPSAPVAPAAPVVPSAPQVAAPVVANAPAGRKKPDDPSKGKFRETMWFKKGDLDAEAAVAAAEERARTGKEVATDKADSLPIDERYKDDGSISRSDKEKYSLRTGATMMMSAMPDQRPDGGTSKVGEDVLVGEMKGGRKWVLIAIIGAVVAIAVIVALFAR